MNSFNTADDYFSPRSFLDPENKYMQHSWNKNDVMAQQYVCSTS